MQTVFPAALSGSAAAILASVNQTRSPSGDRFSPPPLFREEQRFRQWWYWALITAPAALGWWIFVQQIIGGRPLGHNPAPDWAAWLIWLLVGVGLPAFFGLVSMLVEVTADHVHIRYRPFLRRTIPLSEISSAESRTYSPLKEYGGWGVRGWSKANMAYTVSGNRGVELTFTDGRRLLLGSRRADELAAAIQSGLARRPRSEGSD